MADYKPFSKYLAEAKAARGLSAQPAATSLPMPKVKPQLTTKSAELASQGSGDFWSSMVDILSRPLYSVTNPINQSFNEIEKRRIAEETGQPYDYVGALGNQLTAGLRGWFSTNPADKATTAQLIEKGTDVYGPMVDKNYKDVQNNVNPVLAGTLGFVGDVVADPLTWVTMGEGALAKLGAQAFSKAIPSLSKGFKWGEEASIKAAEELKRAGGVAGTTEESMAAADDLLGGGIEIPKTVEDIKVEAVADINMPGKTETEAQLKVDVAPDAPSTVKVVDDQLAGEAADVADAAGATKLPPTFLERMLNLPKIVNVKGKKSSVVEAQAAWVRDARSGRLKGNVSPLPMDRWRTAIKNTIKAGYDDAGNLSEDLTKLRNLERNPAGREKLYNAYRSKFLENQGNVDLRGNLVAPQARPGSVEEWLTGLFKAGNKDDIVMYPEGVEAPFGAKYLTPSLALEAIQDGTIEGVELSAKQLKQIREEVTAAFDELFPVQASSGAVANMRASLIANPAAAEAVFGKDIVNYLLTKNLKDDRLESMMTTIEDVASGSRSFDEIESIVTGKGERIFTTPDGLLLDRMAKFLSSQDSVFANAEAYNLARREAVSKVNKANRKEIAAAWDSGMEPMDAMQAADIPMPFVERTEKWFGEWLRERVTKSKWVIRTDNDIARTAETMGEGLAYDARELSTYDMWDLLQKSMDFAITEAKKLGLGGFKRAEFVRITSMQELAIAEKTLDFYGFPMWMGIHHKGTRYLASPTQIIANIFATNPELARMVFFNGGTRSPYTFVVDAVVEMVKKDAPLDKEFLTRILRGEETANYQASINKTLALPEENAFISGGNYGFMTKEERALYKAETGEDAITKSYTGDEIIDMFDEAQAKILANTKQTVNQNAEVLRQRLGSETADLSDEALKNLSALSVDPARIGRGLEYAANLGYNISIIGKQAATLNLSTLRAVEAVLKITPMPISSLAKSASKVSKKAKQAYSKATGVEFKSAVTADKQLNSLRESVKNSVIVGFDTAKKGAAALIDSGADSATVISYLNKYSKTWKERKAQYVIAKAKSAKTRTADEKTLVRTQEQILKRIKSIDSAEATRVEAAPAPKPAPFKKPAKVIDKEMEDASQSAVEETMEAGAKAADDVFDATDEAIIRESPEIQDSTRYYGQVNGIQSALMKPLSTVWGDIPGAVLGRLSRFANKQHVANLWHSVGINTGIIRSGYTRQLKQLSKLAPEDLKRIWVDAQNGLTTKGFETESALMRNLIAQVHDISGDAVILNDPMFRSGQGIETINSYLKKAKIPDRQLIDIDKAKQYAQETGEDLWTAAARQWRDLNIDDPINYLAQRHAAIMKMSSHMAMAYSFKRMVKANGLISDVAKPGYVKAAGLEGHFFKFLPEDTYIDAVLMKELQALSDASDLSRSLDGQIGEFINKYLLPAQNSWKYAITLPRPGHHIRNFIGTLSLIFLAEGGRFLLKSGKQAVQVLKLRHSYNDIDMHKALMEMGENATPMGGDVLVKTKHMDVTNELVYNEVTRNGLLPTYHVGEDYVDDIIPETWVSKIADKATLRGGRIEKVAGGISEYRDHHGRIQQYLQILHKYANDPQFKTFDELSKFAADRVKKFQPDSTMLTAWEAKYMRTLIPFYSWFRGVLPALIESTALTPGRFMLYPKASFNLAYAMGVNPDSLYDPFPEDQLFPSFLTEQITGPVADINGMYFGVNPGIASLDVYNTLGQDPLRGIAGMTSPLLRVPIELMAGSSIGTGSKIKDPSDYIDASIPGVNYLANITGVSPTGSVSSIFQGKGLDPQYQVSAGNKEARDQALSFINWMTGFGIQNFSKPNYINYAEIEKRNAAAKDQRSGF